MSPYYRGSDTGRAQEDLEWPSVSSILRTDVLDIILNADILRKIDLRIVVQCVMALWMVMIILMNGSHPWR